MVPVGAALGFPWFCGTLVSGLPVPRVDERLGVLVVVHSLMCTCVVVHRLR